MFLLIFAVSASSHARETAPVDTQRLVALSDMDAIQYLDAPRVSPDGKHIAYAMNGRIYVVARDNGQARPVTTSENSASTPRWSANGEWLYFLSDRSGLDQVWKLPAQEMGEALQVTDFHVSINDINFSPDENLLLLSYSGEDLAVADDEQEPQPIVITRRQFKRDAGNGYITAAQLLHLYAYDVNANEYWRLSSADFDEYDAAWSPDGRRVVFVSNRDAEQGVDYSSDLWQIELKADGTLGTTTRLTRNRHTKQSPAYSPDGSQVAYITAVDGVYGQQQLAVVPADGGNPRILTTNLDRWVTAFQYSGDGKWLYFNYDDSGASKFARIRVSDGRLERLVDADVAVWSFHVRGKQVALNMNKADDLPELYALDGRKLRQLTRHNATLLDGLKTGSKSAVSFKSSDGTVVEGFITTPPGYAAGTRYPAILKIHGGPVGQFNTGFDFATQYLAAQGYVVIEPNPRGSSGRGQQFIRAIYKTWGITDYPDVIAAVDYAIDEGIADPERLAVTGYSYGGYMTNVVITQTDRFKAAASGAGHSLIAANFGHDMYQQWYSWELGPPWEDRAAYDRLSPLLRVANVSTPTLFMGGAVDWNVPLLNAELFYQSLRVRGIDSQLVVYPGAHHGGWPLAFEKDYLERMVDWFDRYLADE